MRRIIGVLAAAVVLAAAGVPAATGGEQPPLPAGWIKCAQCGKIHPAGWPHCTKCKDAHPADWEHCATCGRAHPLALPCPSCPPDGFEKCPKPDCGAFFPKGGKCPYCSRPRMPLRSATCPVCSKAFNGPLPFNRNDKGGVDRDFCRHSLGRDVVEALVWSCPRCGHTDWCPEIRGGREESGRFGDKVNGEYAAAVLKDVKPLAASLLSAELGRLSEKLPGAVEETEQTDIPDWIKYRLALKCAALRGEKPEVVAKLALEGSYACRREVSRAVDLPAMGAVIAHVEATLLRRGAGDEDQRTMVRACADMLKQQQAAGTEGNAPEAKLSAAEQYYLYLRIAAGWNRLGDPALALDALDRAVSALKTAGDPAGVKPLTDLAQRRRDLVEREKEFRATAIDAMRRALVDQEAYPAAAVVPTVYLLGELLRRQGDFARARTWLTVSGKLAGPDHPLSIMVAEAMQLPSMQDAGADVEEEAAAVALVAKLTGRKPEDLLGPPEEVGPAQGPVPTAVPLTCAEALRALGAAVRAHAEKHRRAPGSLEELVTGGFIGEKVAGGFKCPECGAELRYRQPKSLDDAEAIMIWHPAGGKCPQLIMYADGKIREKK